MGPHRLTLFDRFPAAALRDCLDIFLLFDGQVTWVVGRGRGKNAEAAGEREERGSCS